MSVWVFFLALISIFYATYLNQKSSRRQYEQLEKQLEAAEKNEIKYDFNKFNTKVTNNGATSIEDGLFSFQSDVKHIQVANETLGLTVQSKFEKVIFRTQLFIKPFVYELFEEESYRQFDMGGIIIFSGFYSMVFGFRGESSKTTEEEVTYWNLEEVILDPNEDQIIFKGSLMDGSRYKLYLNQKNFELKLEALFSAVREKSNFQPFYKPE